MEIVDVVVYGVFDVEGELLVVCEVACRLLVVLIVFSEESGDVKE